MKITKRTLWRRLEPSWAFVTKDERKALGDVAERELQPMWSLRLYDFVACVNGDFRCIKVTSETNDSNITVLQKCWLERFGTFVTQLCDCLERLRMPETSESRSAAAGQVPLTFEEALYTFCRRWFSLPSYNAADGITLREYLLARTEAYNEALYQKRLSDGYARRAKSGK